MSLILLMIAFLISPLTNQFVFAQTVLIPDQMVSAEDYLTKCKMDGYICVQNFQLTNIQNKPTPLFDELIDSIDLSNKVFLTALPKKIQHILQVEMISADQLNMLVRLLEPIESSDNRLILSEVKFISSMLTSEKKLTNFDEDFIIFFKIPIKKANFEKIKKSVFDLPYYEVVYNRLAQPRSTNGKNTPDFEFLISGTCKKFTTNLETEPMKSKIYFEKSCSWTDGFEESTQKMYHAVSENKHWIITGVLILSAALVANQYEVTFQY